MSAKAFGGLLVALVETFAELKSKWLAGIGTTDRVKGTIGLVGVLMHVDRSFSFFIKASFVVAQGSPSGYSSGGPAKIGGLACNLVEVKSQVDVRFQRHSATY